ncbi:glutamyl-tRNA amidotransferase [Lasiosphaeria miniovina]|uniref:Glutamyl-tRNA amidotransferase n=1 Tax=Lasiosphaeria miniovina TaxID=1954250 RepID=A0AA40AKG5_9PEZI|nr:glutamyl-tRNA amidotransferase [Lasiosphaeria miniovina]KAK0717464.1 glutamyl-tRNA amidotransferase [Lasiosphaeria miniovina]
MSTPRRSVRSLGLSILSLVSLSSLSTASSGLAGTGLSVVFNDVYYYISPFPSGRVPMNPKSLSSVPTVFGFKPVTVIQDAIAESEIPDLFTKWAAEDDVFQTAFTQAIFLAGSNQTCLTKREIIPGGATSSIVGLNVTTVPSGPYFLEMATGSLHPVSRLYEDFAQAFLQSLIRNPEGKFQPMSAQIPGSASLTIGVPSRLYFTKTAAKPLAGVRLAVKDIYRLAGVKGSNGNRAWYDLYPASTYTGPAIQRLIDAGAIVVGLQKTSQFANGETATADWVDYHSPFNPRGDGYQDPSSSSSGAGASMGSYDWLDLAIGSDTGGSIRGPAGVQGLFGNRPSHGLVSLDNVMPLAPTLDTPGFLIRDPYLWDAANAALYGSNYKSLVSATPNYPKTIRTVSFPASAGTSASSKILLDFVSALANLTGATVKPLTLATEWTATGPAGAAPLSQYLNTTYPAIITKEQIKLVRDPFYGDYAAANGGRLPFINPVPLSRWGYGDTLSEEQLQAQYTARETFMGWFNTEILAPVADETQCSSSIVLYIGSTGGQNPRNRYGSAPGVPFGFSTGRVSPFTEVPDSVFPLGEVSSTSSITGKPEPLPVAVDVMVAKGCDGLLVRLAQDLVKAGVITIPKTGASGKTGGKILLKARGF